MKLIRFVILLQLCALSSIALSRPATLLIFQGLQGQELSNAAGMNVAHQVLTGLIQKAAPMLVSLDVWNHILERRDRYNKALSQHQSLHAQVNLLIQEIKNLVAADSFLDDINTGLDAAWYQKKYPTLAALDQDKNKEIMFDYFCKNVDTFVTSWQAYRLQDSYVLLLPIGTNDLSNIQIDLHSLSSNASALSNTDLLTMHTKVDYVSLVTILKGLLCNHKIVWNFYLTGHGHHTDASNPNSMIAGMTIAQFQSFLKLLNDQLHTGILVYSSCYSSGMHLIDPYQEDSIGLSGNEVGAELTLNYPIVATCLTDAPVYVFGMPSGLKLPPYTQTFRLEKTDVKHKQLNWYLLQNFTQFVHAVTRRKSLKDIAQSVMMYQECSSQQCNLAKLENIPLIRKPGVNFFVPLDTTFVDFIIHNQSRSKIVENKYGLLWYIKQYDGEISFKNRLAQCISMIPGDGVIWMHRLRATDFSLNEIVQQLFFSVEDLYGVQVYLCEELICRDKSIQKATLQKFMALPNSSWLPRGLVAGDGGLCCYLKGADAYGVVIHKSGAIEAPYKLNELQKKTIQQLWTLLREESATQQELSAELLWQPKYVHHRRQAYEQILQKCQHQLVCCSSENNDESKLSELLKKSLP